MKPLVTLALLVLLPVAAAQTGPWTDGELLVLNHDNWSVYRVVPETGASAVLLNDFNALPHFEDPAAFDSFRGGLLLSAVRLPDPYFMPRLWLVGPDGTGTAIPALNGTYARGLAPTGDGRVFLQRDLAGPQPIEWLDAGNALHTLLDESGTAPFVLEVEFLLWHPQTNSLIGSASTWYSTLSCGTTVDIYRIPLSTDGSRVAGPVSCTVIAWASDIVGLDNLPDGKVLVTANGQFAAAFDRIVSYDPLTGAHAPFAKFQQANMDGGVWSDRTGTAVTVVDGNAAPPVDGLRKFAYAPGVASYGAGIPLTWTEPSSGGWGPGTRLWEVDLAGPACDGLLLKYGAGLAGAGGYVPDLGIIGCPDIGSPFTLAINGAVGGASGLLFVGLSQAALPFKGGIFHVGTVALQVPITLGGAPGAWNSGSLALPALLSDPVLTGVNLYLQAGFVDGDAVQDVSLTNGLRLQGN